MCPEIKFPMSQAVRNAYAEGQEDETLLPLVLVNHQNEPLGRIHSGDAVIFYNIRGEREIELTRSFTEKTFHEFPVHQTLNVNFATMIEYQKGLNVEVAFPPQGVLCDTLSDIIAAHGLVQAKITEAEKAVHVSFFFNGRKSDLLPNEERIVIPTRKDVRLFDEAPEMSIEEITHATLAKIKDPSCNFIVVNFPNVDVVGHVENEPAVIRQRRSHAVKRDPIPRLPPGGQGGHAGGTLAGFHRVPRAGLRTGQPGGPPEGARRGRSAPAPAPGP